MKAFVFAFYITLINSLFAQDDGTQYADVLVDAKYVKWDSTYDRFYGSNSLHFGLPKYMDPRAVLGNNPYYVTIPKGSHIIVGFTDNLIFDHPNQPDLFLDEKDNAGDMAAVYVSSDGIEYTYLGKASGGKTNAMDLKDINFQGILRYVAIEGLDTKGSSPGFDLIRVYGLPGSSIGKYVEEDSLGTYLEKPNSHGRRLLLKPVHFDFNKYDLLTEGVEYLNKLARYLKHFPDTKLLIVGHTDNVGTEEFNKELSLKRAKSVCDFLIAHGFDASHLQFKGMGDTEPLFSNRTEKGRSRNRRVELVKLDSN
ncbi:OmpA family protein [Ekhidna sp.]|uniref:OmpA family protein n=1 Tax=Ekhidna sp. TaxID=2608089 RepID=UPI003C7E5008